LSIERLGAMPYLHNEEHCSREASVSDLTRSSFPPSRVSFVGRSAELEQLKTALRSACSGNGRVMMVLGDAGIGKTRLVETLAEFADTQRVRVLWGRCDASAGAPAFWPWRQVVRGYLDERPADAVRAEGGGDAAVLAQVIPELRERPGDMPPPPSLEADAARRRFFGCFAALLTRLARERPLLLALDDLHWADPLSLTFVRVLTEAIEHAALFLVGCYRDEAIAENEPLADMVTALHGVPYGQRLRLRGLSEADTRAVLEAAGRCGVSAQFVRAIHHESDGNPLFIRELLRHLVNEDVLAPGGSGEPGRILREQTQMPAGLRALIGRCLAGLAPLVRAVLATAAVIGREFSVGTLAYVWEHARRTFGSDAAQVVPLLDEPLAAQIIEKSPVRVDRYRFHHELTRDVLYDDLSPALRAALHRQVGKAIERLADHGIDAHLVELAHHFVRAAHLDGQVDAAISYATRAAEHATKSLAFEQAVSLYQQALQALATTPESPERNEGELALQLALGAQLLATKGHAAAEVETVYARARSLCAHVSPGPSLFGALAGLWSFYLMRAQLPTAQALAAQMAAQATGLGHPLFAMAAHIARGVTAHYAGELYEAQAQLKHAQARYDPAAHRALLAESQMHPEVVMRVHTAQVLGLLGYPDQSRAQVEQALEAARAIGHQLSLAEALLAAALVAQRRREPAGALSAAAELGTIAGERGFVLYRAAADLIRGWALAESGDHANGIALMHAGLTAYEATGAALGVPGFHAWLAEAYARDLRGAAARRAFAAAQAAGERTGLRYFEPELHRLAGQLELLAPAQVPHAATDTAEASFRTALRLAEQQAAKWWGLRAAVSLAQLLRAQHRVAEAQQTLAPIYSWFTEGFETADLRDAKAILDTSAAQAGHD
jgi:predicted ATPase